MLPGPSLLGISVLLYRSPQHSPCLLHVNGRLRGNFKRGSTNQSGIYHWRKAFFTCQRVSSLSFLYSPKFLDNSQPVCFLFISTNYNISSYAQTLGISSSLFYLCKSTLTANGLGENTNSSTCGTTLAAGLSRAGDGSQCLLNGANTFSCNSTFFATSW